MQYYQKIAGRLRNNTRSFYILLGILVLFICAFYFSSSFIGRGAHFFSKSQNTVPGFKKDSTKDTSVIIPPLVLDTALFDQKSKKIANGDSSGRWPVKTHYPLAGAILPFNRIVAYYGNMYSKRMGILGEYPPAEMMQKLGVEIKKWEAADSTMPVQAALHYIAVTAQGSPGKNGKYSLRMPFK
ncbi:MAG TPA: hypothetical protein VGZ71_06235, partial [Puia sp.]|nr:hypothetical protein [Puia sp.]